jgi:uncharacterized protein (DUF4415 family)
MKKSTKKTPATHSKGYDFSKGKRGSVLAQPGKTRITMWIDTDVLAAFREAAEREGRGYQTAMNDALRTAVHLHGATIEERIRAVVREELAQYTKAS